MSATDLVGQTIASQFEVERKLGAGGMGTVYLAEQLGMDRKVVVKVMHPELTAGSAKAVERFKREAKAVARLNHPNIVQIFVFGQAASGQMFIAMEFIEGRDLTDELKQGPLPQAQALRILDQVCSALVEAHGHGIVHRDLKPDNIMLSNRHGNPDYVKVLDFGIAKMADPGQATLTQAGAVFGTPRYMAPEQAKGEQIDTRADVYALGMILYEMLTGVHPFRTATTAIEYIVKHATEEVAPASAAVEGLVVSPRVEAIIQKCVVKDPAARYQSVRELQRELRLALRDLPEAARGFPTPGGPIAVSPHAATVASGPPAAAVAAAAAKKTPAWVWALVGLVVAGGAAAGIALGMGGDGDAKTPSIVPEIAAAGDRIPPTEEAAAPGGSEPATAEERPPNTADSPGTAAKPTPAEAPTTAIAEGMDIDGFPIPARARITGTTAQAEMLETDLPAADVLGFYKAKLAGKYGELQEIPNGLMIKGDSPFSIVSITPLGGGRLTLVLSRNAFFKGAATPGGSVQQKQFLGLDIIDGASVVFKAASHITLRSRKPLREVCDFYAAQVSDLEGVITLRMEDSDTTPTCNFAAAQAPDLPWIGINAVADPMSKGAIMINLQARP